MNLAPKDSKHFETGANVWKFPENPEIVEFPKSEPLNRKFGKFREESQNRTDAHGKKFPKISVYLARLSSSSEFPQNAFLLLTGISGNSNRNISSNGKRPYLVIGSYFALIH